VAWGLDEERVAVGDVSFIPTLGGRLVPGEAYDASAFGLSDAEVADGVAKLGWPLKKVTGSGIAEQPADPDKAVSHTAGEEAAPPQPDGEVSRAALERAAELEAEREPDAGVTEAAKALAEEEGVDLTAVEGSGKGGKVTKDDVAAAAGETG
jgi:pyruvate/2-oxoglutarate dehydrogenase complex dihydrolipoamide acyltransferase (E2) component